MEGVGNHCHLAIACRDLTLVSRPVLVTHRCVGNTHPSVRLAFFMSGNDAMLGDAGKADPMCHAGKTDTTPLGKDKGQGGQRYSRCHVQTIWAMSSAPNKTRPAGDRRWWQSNDDNYGTDVAFGEDWAPGNYQWFAIWYTPQPIQTWYFTPPDKWIFMGYALWEESTGDWQS